MSRNCGSCGAQVGEDARFCAQCGSALSAAAGQEARKVVTALFADVVGSTVLGEQLDPEDFREVVGGAVRRMADCVERYGGSVSELAGDGLLALFGAPIANEDDPERATLAGLAIIEEMRGYAERLERTHALEGFTVRVGVETGLAVLGQVGGGDRIEYGAMGDALNTAARLQAKAEPGSVLVGAGTHRLLAGRFEFGPELDLELKGKADRVAAHPVIAPRETPEPAVGLKAPLIGRERELRLAQDAVGALAQGLGGVLVIGGEAGLGKTRLLGELRRTKVARVRWIEGRCVSYGTGLPYHPFRAVLRDWLGPTPEPDGMRSALRAECERLLGDGGEATVGPLAVMLGLEGAEMAAGGRPELLQERIHAGFADLVAALGRAAPLVLALDDLHWADPSSVALAERLLRLHEAPVLLVLAGRPDAGEPFAALRERARDKYGEALRVIELEALGADAERGLLAGLIGTGTLPEQLESELLARAEGNPFYLEELVRSMIDRGALANTDTGWRFDPEVAVEVPDTVEKVVLARVDRLPATAQEALRAGAVLGRRFSVELLERVVGDDRDLGPAVTDLETADLLRKARAGSPPDYRFKHALIREVVYRSMLKRRRQELHRRAADAIEDLYPDRIDEFVGFLALHCSQANDHDRALLYHSRAGAAARAINSPAEAVRHFGSALEAAGNLGLGAEDRAVRELLVARGEILFELGRDSAAAIADVETAVEAAARSGDVDGEFDACLALGTLWRATEFRRGLAAIERATQLAERLDDPARIVQALTRMAIYQANGLRLRPARELADRAGTVAADQDDEQLMSYARDALKFVAQQTGDLDQLEQHTRLLRTTFERTRETPGIGAEVVYETDFLLMWALTESATVPMARGDFDEAAARAQEALTMLERRGASGHAPIFLETLCRLGRTNGDYRMALEYGRRAVAAAEHSTNNEWGAWVVATHAWTLLDLRAAEEAAALLAPWADRAGEAGAMAQEIRCLSLQAWAASQLGHHDEARDRRARAEQLLTGVNTRPGEAWLFGAHAYFALARVLIDEGDAARGESLVAGVLEAAERFGFLENIAYGALLTGRARLAQEDPAGAEAHLLRALEVADAGGFAGAEWEIQVALAALRREQAATDAADEHAARAAEIVERLATGLAEDPLAATFRDRAR